MRRPSGKRQPPLGRSRDRTDRRSGKGLEGQGHWGAVNSLFREVGEHEPAARPSYTWSVLHVADVAARLEIDRLSVVELGVAGGNGLIALEAVAEHARRATGIEIEIYGLDTGTGLPAPEDHRDAPFLIGAGDFPMDVEELRRRLTSARLVLGPIAETLDRFLADDPAPIGFLSFDLDYYSSTRDALTVLEAEPERLLPRVLCYFDDTLGYPWGDFNGARLAITEFNAAHPKRKVARLHGMRHIVPHSQFDAPWPEALYLAHAFDHPRYGDHEGTELVRSLDLTPPQPGDPRGGGPDR